MRFFIFLIITFCIEESVSFWICIFFSITYFFNRSPKLLIIDLVLFLANDFLFFSIYLFSSSSCKVCNFSFISGLMKLSRSCRMLFFDCSYILIFFCSWSISFFLNLSCLRIMPQLFLTSSPNNSSSSEALLWIIYSLCFFISFWYCDIDLFLWCFLSAFSNLLMFSKFLVLCLL